MTTTVLCAVSTAFVAMVATEVVWYVRRRREEQRQDAQWRETERSIHQTLADPDRQSLIQDVRERALSNQSHLDQLCQATATALHAPAAVITVVEFEGQRWLAFYGAEWCDDNAQDGLLQPLDSSYCQYVVAFDQMLVINDSLRDIRVRTANTRTHHEVRAYLGSPIHAVDGTPVGSLCVFDTTPRKWTERDRTTVSSFASLVSL